MKTSLTSNDKNILYICVVPNVKCSKCFKTL